MKHSPAVNPRPLGQASLKKGQMWSENSLKIKQVWENDIRAVPELREIQIC